MKKLKPIFSIAIVALSLMFAACESMVTDVPEAKLPKSESKLVVNSVISPQLPYINVIITESIPLFTKQM